jgi:hypothetical protein
MAVTAQSIATKARYQTLDTDGVRWTDAEVVEWLNMGQVEVAINKPTASVSNGSIPLVAGTEQTVPAGALALLSVSHNTGDGSPCTLVNRSDLDASLPTWVNATAAVAAEHYMVDEDDPKTFQVYPPNTGAGELYGRTSVLPTTIADIDDDISLDDEYEPVLLEYLLSRIWQKQTSLPNAANRATQHYHNFLRSLGVKIQAGLTYSPRRTYEDAVNGAS